MTTLPVFAEHNALVRAQRLDALSSHPLGTLVAGHKKDVVLTPRLVAAPDRVAIYGWHRPDGTAIQPLYLGHTASWVDYSHGLRLIRRDLLVDGTPTRAETLLADEKRSALLSDEGPLASLRYPTPPAADSATPMKSAALTSSAPISAEKIETLSFEPGVRVVVNSPATLDPAKPIRLVLYAAPAGNTIEHTFGHRLRPGDDWHFDIQHIAAQTRWLRTHAPAANWLVAVLQCSEKSFPTWRKNHPDAPARALAIVDALRARFHANELVLTGHSAGGAFTFAYLDALDRLPDDLARIAFLDSNYAYDSAKPHAAKLTTWLRASDAHRLVVLAYQDYLALLDGKTFVSESGGTWGRSQAMLRDLAAEFPFTRADADLLQTHTALDGRIVFLLRENPERAILHTRQVELNGFIHAMLTTTPFANRDCTYLGPRVYDDLVSPE